jgi:hypothetical protein
MTGSTKIGSQKTAHLAAYNRHFDWEGPLHYVRKVADAPDRALKHHRFSYGLAGPPGMMADAA